MRKDKTPFSKTFGSERIARSSKSDEVMHTDGGGRIVQMVYNVNLPYNHSSSHDCIQNN